MLEVLRGVVHRPATVVDGSRAQRSARSTSKYAHEQVLSGRTAGAEAISCRSETGARGAPVREPRLLDRECVEPPRLLVAAELRPPRANAIESHGRRIQAALRRRLHASPL